MLSFWTTYAFAVKPVNEHVADVALADTFLPDYADDACKLVADLLEHLFALLADGKVPVTKFEQLVHCLSV